MHISILLISILTGTAHQEEITSGYDWSPLVWIVKETLGVRVTLTMIYINIYI